MPNKYFKKATFWAREFRIPLYWLTDKKQKIFGEDTLIIYRKSVIHAYNLNDREIKAARYGYRFFTNKDNLRKYQAKAKEIQNSIKAILIEYQDVKFKKISNAELKRRFLDIIRFLHYYTNIYCQTEPFFLTKIDAEEFKYKDLIKKLGKLRFTLREQGESIFYILIGLLLKEAGKRFGSKMIDLFFYTYDEIIELFNGRKVRKDIIAKRKKGYALISLKNRKILLTGKKFEKLYKEIVIQTKKVKELSGQTAMKGRVRGKIRVILHNKRNISKEVAKFRKGEILVTEMTRPDTVLACRKAAAIITDEGGITSHAAIISRELKIPCVIGTKTATQVLKDGDLVEVNKVKGIVRIIKKKTEDTK